MTSPFQQVAQNIYENGYTPLPLKPAEKVPGQYYGVSEGWRPMSGWQQHVEVGLEQWRLDMWCKWPDGNIGVAHTDSFGAIDFDDDVFGCHDEIKAILAKLDGTVVRRRGAKGYVQYFRFVGVPTAVYKIDRQNALEVLGKGRQTVIPPSVHPSTRQPYEWLTGADNLENVSIEELPVVDASVIEEIEDVLRGYGWDKDEHVQINSRKVSDDDPHTPLGQYSVWRDVNNRALANLDAWVPDLQLCRCEAKHGGYHAVADWRPSGTGRDVSERKRNLSITSEGIKDFGTDKTYTPINLVCQQLSCSEDHAWNWLWERVGYKLEPWLPKNMRDPEPVSESDIRVAVEARGRAAISLPGAMDIEKAWTISGAGGLIGAMADWSLRRTIKPCPEYSIMAGIGVCSVLFGRHFTTPTNGDTNVFMVGIGGSGYGKEEITGAAKALLEADPMLNQMCGPDDFSSDSAIYTIVHRFPKILLPIDEFGIFLGNVQAGRASPHEARIKRTLLELYSKKSWTGRVTASQEEQSKVYSPCLSIIGATTPTEFVRGISESNLSDGLLGRFIYIVRRTRPPMVLGGRAPEDPPERLVERFREAWHITHPSGSLCEAQGVGNMEGMTPMVSTMMPAKVIIPWADDAARDAWSEISAFLERKEDEKPELGGIVNRGAFNVLKLATIRAMSRSMDGAQVTVADVAWGAAIVEASINDIISEVAQNMSSSTNERNVKKVLNRITYAASSGKFLTVPELMLKCTFLRQREFDETLAYMEKTGLVQRRSEDRDGKREVVIAPLSSTL